MAILTVDKSVTVRAFHNDPYNPTLFDPQTKALEVSGEQERLIRELHMVGASDTRFAQKMSDAVLHILRAGASVVPAIESLSPESAVVLSPSFQLSVTGTGFDETSTILVNGNDMPTNRVSDTNLTTDVDLSSIDTPAQYGIMVKNGEIISNSVTFDVTAAQLRKSGDKEFDKFKKDEK